MDFNWLNISVINWTWRVSFSILESVINFGSKTLSQDQSKCENMIDNCKLNVKTNSSMTLFHLKQTLKFQCNSDSIKTDWKTPVSFFVLLLVLMQYASNLAIIKGWFWRVLVSTKFWLIFLLKILFQFIKITISCCILNEHWRCDVFYSIFRYFPFPECPNKLL